MKKVSFVWIVLIQFTLAFEWLHSAFGKWAHPEFINGISQTLTLFGTKTTFQTYGHFLLKNIVPHAHTFGNIIRVGELGVGVGLAASGIIVLAIKRLPNPLAVLTAIACFGAALMNLNFFLASGWSSPAAWGLNILMLLIEIILGIFYIQQIYENKTLRS